MKKLHKLRFIFAIMEDGRRTILVTTNFALTAIDCIVAYAMRYKEEKMLSRIWDNIFYARSFVIPEVFYIAA